MTKSSLTDEVVLADSSNYTHGRKGYRVCKITPHHMAGILTGTQCAKLFQNANRNASANYCIGVDGDIVLNVPEEYRAWTSSSSSNDCQAITIEVSDCDYDWHISEKSWNSLINLCVDICNRYNFKLTYDGTPNGSLTRHNMFANTNCPGAYLQNKFPELVEEVNKRLGVPVEPIKPVDNNTGLDPLKEEKPMYKFRNGRTIEPIFADKNHTKQIGYLNKYEVCDCYGLLDGVPIVRYKIDKSNNYKIGFAVDKRCVTNN